MQVTEDLSRGAWLRPRLSGWGSRDSVVPSGFEAYLRVFHPRTRYWWQGPVNTLGSTRVKEETMFWAEVAAVRGTVAHPWMQWGAIAQQQDGEIDLGDGTSVDGGFDGYLPWPTLQLLLPALRAATTTADDVTVGVWEGWGELHDVVQLAFSSDPAFTPQQRTVSAAELGVDPRITDALDQGRLLELPGRRYVLLTGGIDDLAQSDWTVRAGLGSDVAAPQLLWPADRAWCLACEIDFDFTLIGGSQQLIERLLAARGIEAALLPTDGDLTWDGDAINPRAPDR